MTDDINKIDNEKEIEENNALIEKTIEDMDLKNYLSTSLSKMQPERSYTLNDKGNGELFADIFKDRCRYNTTAKEWYVYNGKIWIEDTGAMATSRCAKNLYDALVIYSTTIKTDTIKEAYQKHVIKLGQLKFRKVMIEDAKDKYYITNKDLDRYLFLFNCQNGVIDLKTFKFINHSPYLLLSKISNVIYDPKVKSTSFEKFISDIMENKIDKIEYLQKLLGYSITGETSEESCYLFYGSTTRNGKSTLVETYSHMLGNSSGYALNMEPETLAQKHNKDSRQASGDIARLNGCRFVNAAEPPKRMIFDTALLKTLIGRDTMTARHLHQREFEFIPCFKLIINTNYLPIINDDTLFTSGRLVVITFDRHFNPEEQDKKLKDKLKQQENISGMFNWCLDGLKKFYMDGLKQPKSIIDATEEYRSSSDKIGNFILECLEVSDRNTKAKDIYDIYQKWCQSNGYGFENKSNFFSELNTKGLLSRTGTVNGMTYSNVVKGYVINDWKSTEETSFTY